MGFMLRKSVAVCAILTCLAPQQAMAHPHEFVTLRIQANFTPDGKVSGMQYNWTFDEFFSAYAIEGQDANANGKAEQSELDALLAEILGNIGPIQYFTKFDQKSVSPKIGKAKPVKASMKGREYVITFDVPFDKPVSVTDKPLTYAIYDDEFYVAMQHADANEALVLNNAPKGCKWELTEPEPDDDVAAFASSLDKTESGGSDLGISFAEWVSISCK